MATIQDHVLQVLSGQMWFSPKQIWTRVKAKYPELALKEEQMAGVLADMKLAGQLQMKDYGKGEKEDKRYRPVPEDWDRTREIIKWSKRKKR